MPDRLSIRANGGNWQPLAIVDGAASITAGCFASYPPGTTTTFTLDLSVTVRWTDSPAALGDVIVFQVTTG